MDQYGKRHILHILVIILYYYHLLKLKTYLNKNILGYFGLAIWTRLISNSLASSGPGGYLADHILLLQNYYVRSYCGMGRGLNSERWTQIRICDIMLSFSKEMSLNGNFIFNWIWSLLDGCRYNLSVSGCVNHIFSSFLFIVCFINKLAVHLMSPELVKEMCLKEGRFPEHPPFLAPVARSKEKNGKAPGLGNAYVKQICLCLCARVTSSNKKQIPGACPGFLKGGGPISLGSLKKGHQWSDGEGSSTLVSLGRPTNLAYLDAKEWTNMYFKPLISVKCCPKLHINN